MHLDSCVYAVKKE